MGNMPHAMSTSIRPAPLLDVPPFSSANSSSASSNVPMTYGARSSTQVGATPPYQSGSFRPIDHIAYPISSDVTQVPPSYRQPAFTSQANEGFMPQQSYVAEYPTATSGSRNGQLPFHPHGINPTPSSLASLLAETATMKQQSGNAYNPEIPAQIMSKYGNDVMEAIELTTFLSSRGLTFKDGQVDIAQGSPMEYAL